jgi:protein-S-isoprenylcysteine O-methyltransferase Ste14
MLFLKAVLAFLALPGLVAFVTPLLLLRPVDWFHLNLAGVALVVVGTVLLLWCVWNFYAVGRGTLAPWSPPQSLVMTGPYRLSRNPMYVAVSLILWGWAIGFESGTHAIYALVVMLVFFLRVTFGEEPSLDRQFRDEWRRYKAGVRRWL